MRLIKAILVGVLLATVGIGPARAAAPSAVVLPAKATIAADGSVNLTMKVRCNTHERAFEWSVEIRQGAIYGNDSAGPVANLITCDGRFHKVHAYVEGANGPYTAGPANVQALVQLNDSISTADVELEDVAVVQLRG